MFGPLGPRIFLRGRQQEIGGSVMSGHRFCAILWTVVLAAALAAPSDRAQDNTAGRIGESEGSLAPGTPIFAVLNNGLDSKKVKVGDAAAAHTIEAVKSADARTILPRGTKLVGRITDATARSKGDGQSVLGLTFEKAILKDGGEVSIYARIQAITTPASFAVGEDGPPRDTANMGTTQTSPMGGRSGPPASAPPERPSLPGSEQSGPALTPNSRGVIGLKGLTLSTSRADKILVSTIASDGKNVHLDSGTRMLIVTQPPPPEEPPASQDK
jgi:hypothetical protein